MKVFNKTALAAAFLLASCNATTKDHCYDIAFAGGGTKGAYEAGVFWSLIKNAQDLS